MEKIYSGEATSINSNGINVANVSSITATTPTLNILGQPIEFGIVQDPNISSTILGLAVKVNNNWRVFDKEKKSITDVMGLQLGNFPIMIMPSTKLSMGDLIKENNEYLYVVEVNSSSVKTLNVNTGVYQEISPVQNLFGINFYSKLITFEDKFKKVIGTNGGFDIKSLLILGMLTGGFITGDNQNPMNNGSNDMFGGMGIQSMLMLSFLFNGLGEDGNNLFGSLFGGNETNEDEAVDNLDYKENGEIVFTNKSNTKNNTKKKSNSLFNFSGDGDMNKLMNTIMLCTMFNQTQGTNSAFNLNTMPGGMQGLLNMIMMVQILK